MKTLNQSLLTIVLCLITLTSYSQALYSLSFDENDNKSVAEYDHTFNALSNSSPVSMPDDLNSETATYDAQNKKIIFGGDDGIYAVNVLTGAVTTQPFPFAGNNGYALSLHYDYMTEVVYALYQDENDNKNIAEYVHATNTLSNSSTVTMSDDINSETATLHPLDQQIVFGGDTGIYAVHVISGAVTAQPFPFAGANGYALTLHYDFTSVVTAARESTTPQAMVQLYPNPCQDEFSILSQELKGSPSIQITNALGQIVLQDKLSGNNKAVDVSQLSPGMYFVQVGSKNSIKKKLLIQ